MLPGIGIASFLESIIIPIPLEAILVPLMQVRRDYLWLIATVTTFGCVLGAMLGYVIGFFLFELIKDWLFIHITTEVEFNAIKEQINKHGFLFVFSTGVTPVPLQIAMIVAGVTNFSFGLYLLAVTLSRCIRYFGFALLVKYYGNKTEKKIRKYKSQVGLWILLLIFIAIIYKTVT